MTSSKAAVLWTKLAAEVDRLTKPANVKEVFRQRVREAAGEWLRVFDEKGKRDQARREALMENGVWHGRQKLPERPSRTWFHWVETFRGAVNLPDALKPPELCQPDEDPVRQEKVFEHIKSRGFPNDAEGNTVCSYSLDVEGWLPSELSPDLDPDDSLPLPVPKRQVSLGEKYAALAAIHDAYWKVAGDTIGLLSEDAVDVEASEAAEAARKEAAEQDAEKAATEAAQRVHNMSGLYHALVIAAEQLDEENDPSYLEAWLNEVWEDIRKLYSARSRIAGFGYVGGD